MEGTPSRSKEERLEGQKGLKAGSHFSLCSWKGVFTSIVCPAPLHFLFCCLPLRTKILVGSFVFFAKHPGVSSRGFFSSILSLLVSVGVQALSIPRDKLFLVPQNCFRGGGETSSFSMGAVAPRGGGVVLCLSSLGRVPTPTARTPSLTPSSLLCCKGGGAPPKKNVAGKRKNGVQGECAAFVGGVL